MKRTHITATALLAAALFPAFAAAQYTLIPYSDKMVGTATSSYTQSGNNRIPMFALNGAGLDANGETHSVDAATMWMSDNSKPTWFRVDLGDEYTLGAIKFWNFNMNNGTSYAGRGLNSVDIYFSTNNTVSAVIGATPDFGNSEWQLLKSGHAIEKATGNATYTGDALLEFPAISVRWVGVKINSSHSTENYMGLSEVQFFTTGAPGIALDNIAVTSATTLDFAGTLSSTGDDDTAMLLSCHGTTDGDAEFGAWDVVTEHGDIGEGDFAYTLDNIVPGYGYYFTVAATNSGTAWNVRSHTFIAGALTVEAPEDFYENELAAQYITFRRPQNSTNVSASATYRVNGTAVAGTHYRALSGSVTFAEGVAEVREQISPIDNNSGEDRTVTITLDAGNYLTGEDAATTFAILGKAAAGERVTWTGGAGDAAWQSPGNWSPARVPRVTDDVAFTSAGIANGAQIMIDRDVQINTLTIAGTESFSIVTNTANHRLITSGIDIDASGKTITFGARVFAAADASGTSVWHIAAGTMRTYGGTTTDTGVVLRKTGAGALTFSAGSLHSGVTHIAEGAANTSGSGMELGGNLIVGTPDGNTPASYTTLSGGSGVPKDNNVTVYANGTYYQGDYPGIKALTVYGGLVQGNWPNIAGTVTMQGGRITAGPLELNSRYFTTLAADTTATVSGENKWSEYVNGTVTYTIADGPAPVDFKTTGTISHSSTSQNMVKTGAGLMQIAGSLNFSSPNRVFNVNAGTLLIDNTTQGVNPSIAVNAGATLGGTGRIGGGTSATNATVTVSGSAGNPATIAPGTIDENTGAHIIGTLTVGSESVTNNVTFGNYSTLRATVGTDFANDMLDVYGAVTISGTGTTLEIDVAENAQGGAYTLVSATEGVSGKFANVTTTGGNKNGFVVYTDTEVTYEIPSTLLIIR